MNILVVRNDRFGEFLLNIPALNALKQTFQNSKIILVVNPYLKELAKSLPAADEILEWQQGRHSFLEKIKLIGLLKARKIDIAVMLNPSKEFNLYSFLVGIPIRLGYARKWGFLLTHKVKDQKQAGLKHEIEYNLDLVGLIGAKTENRELALPLKDCFVSLPIIPGGFASNEIIAIHPWTSDPVKQWPIKSFRELAERIVNELNYKVLIVGKTEASQSRFFDSLNEGIHNITNKTSLNELAVILKKCKLLVSGDSGPVHLASCVGTPVIALFRSDLPGKTARRWGPWGEGHTVIERNNLADITVKDVLDKIEEKLNVRL